MTSVQILTRLFNDYTKKYVPLILLALIFSLILAASTSSIAWLLDPAVEKLFIQKNQNLMYLIPLGIVIAFTCKGLSLYFAKTIMISVGEEVRKSIQVDMMKNLIKADTEVIEKRHSGKIITNLISDVNFMTGLVSVGILNLLKDSLTLIGLVGVMVYQNWKLSIVALIMMGTYFKPIDLSRLTQANQDPIETRSSTTSRFPALAHVRRTSRQN